MHRRGLLLVAMGVLIVSLVVFAGCSSTKTTTPTTPKTTPKTTPSTTPSGTSSTVSVVDFSFQPATLTVKTGGTVTWKNNGATAHDITFTDFTSGALQPGLSFSHTFNTAGTFPYHCAIHPSMTGTIVVTASGTSSTSTTPSTTPAPAPPPTPSY
ncbi:MAG: cupredoxin domain-containing protein [Candidatus Geothermincolia bacterium]